MDELDGAIRHVSSFADTIHEYHLATAGLCVPALLLLWNPDRFIVCETKYRSLMSNNLSDPQEYKRFKKEISEPFQAMIQSVYTDVKVSVPAD